MNTSVKFFFIILSTLSLVRMEAQKLSESKFWVGAETGININQSDYLNDTKKTSVQGGIMAEYLLSKNFSVMAKIKYYESQVIFSHSKIIGSNWFGPQYQYFTCEYNGKIITVPVTLNYNFNIYRNVSGGIRLGPSINAEIAGTYDYHSEVNKDFSNIFVGLNWGANLNYNTETSTYFIGFEPLFGAKRGTRTGTDFNGKTQTHNFPMENYLFNVGAKFRID